MKTPFVIFSLPRSRTFWLSNFLTYKDWVCGHEQARYVRDVDDIKSWLSQDAVGTIETAATPYWRLTLALRPDIRVITIRRPVDEVVDSAMATGAISDRKRAEQTMRRFDLKLDQIERRTGAKRFNYSDLAKEDVCAEIFEYCLPYRHDSSRWRDFNGRNLQINLPSLLRYEAAHSAQLTKIKLICDQKSRALMWREKKITNFDGMTFQEEDFETAWRDGERLFAEHCVVVGESPDSYLDKNIPLIRDLNEIGAIQVVTARCNGRMFGYLMTVIGPSLETTDADVKVATQTTFYGSPDASGIGIRLQRAADEALRHRGGKYQIIHRAGVRGEGNRISALYKRMGAEPFGQLFRRTVGYG